MLYYPGTHTWERVVPFWGCAGSLLKHKGAQGRKQESLGWTRLGRAACLRSAEYAQLRERRITWVPSNCQSHAPLWCLDWAWHLGTSYLESKNTTRIQAWDPDIRGEWQYVWLNASATKIKTDGAAPPQVIEIVSALVGRLIPHGGGLPIHG